MISPGEVQTLSVATITRRDRRLLRRPLGEGLSLPQQPHLASQGQDFPLKLRRIAGLYIAQHYPHDDCGLAMDAQGLWADNAGLLVGLPVLYPSPGYGNDDVVGNVGLLTIHADRGEVVEATPTLRGCCRC